MNSNKSAGLLSRLVILIAIGVLASCNPYYHTIRQDDPGMAARQIIETLDKGYPFSGHKGIVWEEDLQPLKSLLEQDFNDSVYRQIKALFYRIPDSRLLVNSPLDEKIMQKDISGYLGFDLTRDSDGSCKIIRVDTSSSAWEKGLRPGNTILGWNGDPVIRVIENSQIYWGIHPASEAFRIILQNHFMTRGPAGQSVELFIENHTGNAKGIRLYYRPEEISLVPDYIGIPEFEPKQDDFRMVGQTGILTISSFSDKFYNRLINKLLPQIENTNGLIIDLRENTGGLDEIAAGLAQWFVSQEYLYEETLLWDPVESVWTDMGHIHIEPVPDFVYDKPIIVLIGPKCNGAGEGFARVVSQEPNITTLGIWNTAGSFSFPGGRITLPGKFKINYPIGMSLDGDGVILIESPGDYGGGIYPDIRLANNAATLAAICSGYDVLLEEALSRLK